MNSLKFTDIDRFDVLNSTGPYVYLGIFESDFEEDLRSSCKNIQRLMNGWDSELYCSVDLIVDYEREGHD